MFDPRQAMSAAVIVIAATAANANPARSQEAASPEVRENIMKSCGDKWRAVRAVESAKGVTWPQYLARCRAETAGGEPTSTGAGKRSRSARSGESASPAAGDPVFPSAVSARHSGERPTLARQRTCADQFKANKVSGANGGLRWIQKGGGYWSKCNAHLKQLRA
ncbi:MAG: hypothetical protein ACK4MV_07550 [Beijerinckiaceae bacterium]